MLRKKNVACGDGGGASETLNQKLFLSQWGTILCELKGPINTGGVGEFTVYNLKIKQPFMTRYE